MRYDERPVDDTAVHTDDLPPTPIRDRNIPATAWVEAPATLLTLGDDLPDRPDAPLVLGHGPVGQIIAQVGGLVGPQGSDAIRIMMENAAAPGASTMR